MHLALHLGAQKKIAYNDSQLVVNQFNDEFEARKGNMDAYLKKAHDKAAKFKGFSLFQVPREQKSLSNSLMNLVSALQANEQRTVALLNLG